MAATQDKTDKVKVVIAVDPDFKKIGKEQTVDRSVAQAMVAEGRARYADEKAAPPQKQAGHGQVDGPPGGPVDATDSTGQQAGARKS